MFCPDCAKNTDIPCLDQAETQPTCVSELQLCDGTTDCPNHMDEHVNCANGEVVWIMVNNCKVILIPIP